MHSRSSSLWTRPTPMGHCVKLSLTPHSSKCVDCVQASRILVTQEVLVNQGPWFLPQCRDGPGSLSQYRDDPRSLSQYRDDPRSLSQYRDGPRSLSHYRDDPRSLSQYRDDPRSLSQYRDGPWVPVLCPTVLYCTVLYCTARISSLSALSFRNSRSCVAESIRASRLKPGAAAGGTSSCICRAHRLSMRG